MILGPVLAIHMDLSVKPEINQLELMKGRFQCEWHQDPYPPPFTNLRGDETEEVLFRMLLDSMDKEAFKARKPASLFRSTMEPRLD